MHQHARKGDGRGGGHGIADARPAIPAGRAGPVGTQWQRNDARVFLRPHLGRTGWHPPVRVQRLVHGYAECHDTDVHGYFGQRGACPVQPLVRLRHGHGDRRHCLRLGDRTVDGRGTFAAAAHAALPQGTDGHRLDRGIRHETAQDLLHRQPRHHAAYTLHRGGLHLLHGGLRPAWKTRCCWP